MRAFVPIQRLCPMCEREFTAETPYKHYCSIGCAGNGFRAGDATAKIGFWHHVMLAVGKDPGSGYCSRCSPLPYAYFYDLCLMALYLKIDESRIFSCQVCEYRGIYKDEKRRLFLAKPEDGEIKLYPVHFDELIGV